MAEKSGNNDIGVNMNVVLSPSGNEKIAGSFKKQITTNVDKAINELTLQNQELAKIGEPLAKLLDATVKHSTKLKKSAITPQIKAATAEIQKLTTAQGKAASHEAFNKGEIALSDAFARLAVLLETLQPSVKSRSKRPEVQQGIQKIESLINNYANQIKHRNRGMSAYGDAYGLAAVKANPGLDEHGLGGQISALKKYDVAIEREQLRHLRVMQKQNATITGLEKSLPRHGGMVLDVETFNFGHDSAWAIASKTNATKLGVMQRAVDSRKITQFHANYAKGLEGTNPHSAQKIVEEIYDQYAGMTESGNLLNELPPFIGHNNDFDIKRIGAMAQGVNTRKGKELAAAMARLQVGGINAKEAAAADTQKLFDSFLRNEMGYTSLPSMTAKGSMGRTLGAATAAFGYKLNAHDPASDVAGSEFLYRLLNNDPKTAKELFKENKSNWLRQAEKDTLASELRRAASERFGKENMHLASMTSSSFPEAFGGAEAYRLMRGSAVEQTQLRLHQLKSNLQITDIPLKPVDEIARQKELALQNKRAIESQRSMYNEKVKKASGALENSLFLSTNSVTAAEMPRAIDTALENARLHNLIKEVAGATGNPKEEQGRLISDLKERIRDNYVMEDYSKGENLNRAFDSFYKDNARTKPKIGSTDKLEAGLMRMSTFAQAFNDQGGSGGAKTFDFLRKQFKEGATVPAISPMATEYGNVFETKAFEELTNQGYKLLKTGDEQVTLKLGDGKMVGHPDGFLYNPEGNNGRGQGSLVEAKYRGNLKQDLMAKGPVPRAYVAQASMYAMAAGIPNLPTTYVTGNLERANERTDEIDGLLNRGMTGKPRLALEKERLEITEGMSIKDMRLASDFTTRTVLPDKQMISQLEKIMPAVLGKDFNPKAAGNLDTSVIEHLSGGKKLTREALDKKIAEANAAYEEDIAATKKMAKAANGRAKVLDEDSMTISRDNPGERLAEQRAADAAAKVSKAKIWNPNVSSSIEDENKKREDLLKKAKEKVLKLDLQEKGMNTYYEKIKAAGVVGDDRLDLAAAKKLRDGITADKKIAIAEAQGLMATLPTEKAITAKDPKAAAGERTAQLRLQLSLEKEQLIVERELLAVKLRLDKGKYANGRDTQRAAELNQILSTRHGVGGSAYAVGEKELSEITRRKGLEKTSAISGGGGGGGGKGKGGKDFVGGAIDLLDWQIQWMAGVTVLNAISGAFKNSIGFAVEFEAAMKNVQLITQANTSEMDTLTGNLKELTSTFQYSATELGQGLIVLGQAGFSAAESLHILPAVTALATATLSDLKTATDITTTAIKAFNIPVEETGRIVNTLASMTIESKLDIEKLGTSFNYIASTASAAGFSLEEAGTAMGLMSNAGVRASTIGTTLRSVIGSLLHPTEKFETALASVGLSVEEVSPTYNSLGEIFKTLRAAGFDVETAFAGLDKRIAGGAITLVRSADQFDSFQASITGTNRAFDMATKQMDTFNAQTKRMKNIGQLLGNDLFSSSLGPLKDVAKLFNKILETMLAMSEAVPDSAKSLGASIGGLTIGSSLAFGVSKGVYGVGKDVRAALATEDLTRLPDQKRGFSLEKRNKQVYSMYSTFFSPKALAIAAAVAVAVAGVAWAYKELSGEAELLRSINIKDKFVAEGTALDAAVAALDRATGSTTKLIAARKTLLALGVEDVSPTGIRDAQALNSLKSQKASRQVFRARIEKDKRAGNAMSPEDRAQLAKDYLSSENRYWSGNEGSRSFALRRIGLNLGVRDKKAFNALRAGDLENPAAGRFTLDEATNRLRKAGDAAGAIDRGLGTHILTKEEKTYYTELRKQKAGKVNLLDSGVNAEKLAILKAAADKSIKVRPSDRNNAAMELRMAGKNYTKTKEAGLSKDDQMLYGTAKQAKQDYDIAVTKIAAAKEYISKQQALEGVNPDYLKILTDDLAGLEAGLKLKNKKQIVKNAMSGKDKPRSFEKLTYQFEQFLSDGSGGLDATASAQFKNISATSLNTTGEALLKLKKKQNLEEVRLKEYFGGKVPVKVESALRVKWKIEAQDVIQADVDKAFAPMKKLYSSLTAQAKQSSDFALKNIATDSLIAGSTVGQGAFAERMKGLRSSFTYGEKDNKSRFGGYDSASIGFNSSKERLALKQKTDEEVARESRAQIDKMYDYERVAFFEKYGSLTEVTKTQERELYKIKLDYSRKVVELSRTRTKNLTTDLKTVQALAEKQAQNLNTWKSDKASVVSSFDTLRDDAKERLNPRSKKEKTRDAFRAASNSSYAALKALSGGDKEGAKTAAADAASWLSKIVNDPSSSKRDIQKAKRSAAQYSGELGSGYDLNINKAEASLTDTNSILSKILLVLEGKSILDSNSVSKVEKYEELLAGSTEDKLSELEKTKIKIGEVMMSGGKDFATSFLDSFKKALPLLQKAISDGIKEGTGNAPEDTSTDTEQKTTKVDIGINSDMFYLAVNDGIVNSLTQAG